MLVWLFAFSVVLIAAILQSTIGFGFAVMATPFLLLIFKSQDCIQISMLLSFSIAIALLPRIAKEIDYDLLKKLIIGSLLGVPLGLFFFKILNLYYLKLLVSIVVSTLSLFLLFKWYQQYVNPSPGKQTSSPKQELREGRGFNFEVITGFLAGIFTSSIGMPGIPLVVYFNWKNTKKEITRSTTLAFFTAVYLYSIISQILIVKIRTDVLTSALSLLPAVLLGVITGSLLFAKINEKLFYFIANTILLFTGLYMLQSIF
ncbi:MAG: sulfite exporter TauE/SafE family protein [Peptococcaceae bacterium]